MNNRLVKHHCEWAEVTIALQIANGLRHRPY